MAKTVKEFREWAVAQGKNIKNPTANPFAWFAGQCVSLVQQYLNQVFDVSYKARGNAKDFIAPDFTKVSGTPKPGDILRYQPGKGGARKYGHIGIVDDDGKFLNQNHNGDKRVYRDKIPAGYEIFRPNKPFIVKKTASGGGSSVKVYGYGYITKDALIGRVAAFLREKHPEFTPKAALGNYIGPSITGAIKAYQKLKGLKVDGRFATGGETLRALTADGFKG